MGGKELTVENVLKFMDSWGKPQSWTTRLGPKDAWHYGDNWKIGAMEEQSRYAHAHPEAVISLAQPIFDAIRRIDYTEAWDMKRWQHWLPVPDTLYDCDWMDEWSHWMYVKFKDNPIQSVDVGKTLTWKVHPGYHGEIETPSVPYKLTLKDGTTIEGDLAFFYNPSEQKWYGFEGLDWHKPPK